MSNPPWKQNKPNPTQGKALPPWMKNKQANKTQQNPPQQPQQKPSTPWNKPKQETATKTQLPNQSPQQETKPETKGNAPWKNKGGNPSQTSGTGQKSSPPWMKGKTSNPQTERSNESSVKKEESEQSEKRKEQERLEEEERIRKEEEQKKEEKQKEQKDEEEKDEESEEEVVVKKKTVKKVKSTKNMKKVKTSPTKSPVKQLQNTPFLKYTQLLNNSCSKEAEYDEKIENQKQMLKQMKQFTEKASQTIVSYMKEKKIIQRKRNIINFQDMNAEYALVEGSKKQGKTVFSTDSIQALNSKFKIYNALQEAIIKLVKKLTVFRIRLPLLCLVKYKGIQFLCEGLSQELLKVVASPATNYTEIISDLIQLEKEMKDIGYSMINRQTLTIKKIFVGGQQTYVIYLNENLQFKELISPITLPQLIDLNPLSRRSISYSIDNDSISELKRLSTEKIGQYLDLHQLAKAIQIVYRSCQGEANEESFWSLVLKENPDVWLMVNEAYQHTTNTDASVQSLPTKGILFRLIECLLPIQFQTSSDIFIQEKNVVKSANGKIFMYDLSPLQVFQIVNSFDKYLRQGKFQLAQESIKIQEALQQIDSSFVPSQILLRNKANLSLSQKNYSQVIQTLIQKMQELSKFDFHKIFLLPLLITAYMFEGNEIKMLETFAELLDILSYYFGEEMWIHSTIYSMLGQYYSKLSHDEEAKKFIEHSYAITNQYFGNKSFQLADVLIEKGNIHLNLKETGQCQRSIQEALGIYKISSKHNLKIAECMGILGKAKMQENEGLGKELIERAILEYLQLEQPQEAINLYFYLIENQKQKQVYLEKTGEIAFKYKSYPAIKEAIKAILSREIKLFTTDKSQFLKGIQVEEKTIDESSLQLQEQIHNFGSLIEMVRWSVNVVCMRNGSSDWERAMEIMGNILSLYEASERSQILE